MTAKEDYEKFTNFFKSELGLDGDKLEKFVHDAMEKKGHKKTIAWMDNDKQDDNDNGNIFGINGKQGKREVKKTGTGNWQYDD